MQGRGQGKRGGQGIELPRGFEERGREKQWWMGAKRIRDGISPHAKKENEKLSARAKKKELCSREAKQPGTLAEKRKKKSGDDMAQMVERKRGVEYCRHPGISHRETKTFVKEQPERERRTRLQVVAFI